MMQTQLSNAAILMATSNLGLQAAESRFRGSWLPGQPFKISVDFLEYEWKLSPGNRKYIGEKLSRRAYHFAVHFKDASAEVFNLLGYPVGHFVAGYDDLLIFEIN